MSGEGFTEELERVAELLGDKLKGFRKFLVSELEATSREVGHSPFDPTGVAHFRRLGYFDGRYKGLEVALRKFDEEFDVGEEE